MFSKSIGNFKSAPPTVTIQHRVDYDENGEEINESAGFWLVDGAGNVISGPFSTIEEATAARRNYLKSLGFEA